MCDKSKTKPAVSKLRNSQGELTSNDQETANTPPNDYFASVFAKDLKILLSTQTSNRGISQNFQQTKHETFWGKL